MEPPLFRGGNDLGTVEGQLMGTLLQWSRLYSEAETLLDPRSQVAIGRFNGAASIQRRKPRTPNLLQATKLDAGLREAGGRH